MSRSPATGPCWSNRTVCVSTTSTTLTSGCSGTSDRQGCVARKLFLTSPPAQRGSPSALAASGPGRHCRGNLLGPRARLPQSGGTGAWAAPSRAADPFYLLSRRELPRHRIRRTARGRTRRAPVSRLSIRTEQGLRARSRCRGRRPINHPTQLSASVRSNLPDRRQNRSRVAAARDSRSWPRLRAGMRVHRPAGRGMTSAVQV